MSRQATGLRAWALQRITAVYLGFFFVYLCFHFILAPPPSYEAWRLWVARPWISIALLLFLAALLIHTWIGIRDVLIDYIHPFGLRITLLTLVGLGLSACALWGLQVVMLARIA